MRRWLRKRGQLDRLVKKSGDRASRRVWINNDDYEHKLFNEAQMLNIKMMKRKWPWLYR